MQRYTAIGQVDDILTITNAILGVLPLCAIDEDKPVSKPEDRIYGKNVVRPILILRADRDHRSTKVENGPLWKRWRDAIEESNLYF